jgi:hypothetical protein
MAWAALLLVLTQSLGLVHQVRHERFGGMASVSVQAPDTAHAFGHTPGGAECRLFDQLAHLDLAGVPTLNLPAFHTPTFIERTPPAFIQTALQWRAQARGPPALG